VFMVGGTIIEVLNLYLVIVFPNFEELVHVFLWLQYVSMAFV
jgi:hypothetical protein